MNPKPNFYLPLLFAFTLIVGMLAGVKMSAEVPVFSALFIPRSTNTFNEVTQLIETKYVDTLNLDKLSEAQAADLVKHLDPHSTYIIPQFVEQINEELDGKFEGIGIEYNFFKDTPFVLRVLADGPSFKAGLKMGDKLLAVDTNKLIGNANIRKIIKGPSGSIVKVHILRNGKTMTINITRGVIPIKSVSIVSMLDNVIGYIKIDKFIGETTKEFIRALELLKSKNCKKLILDLRNNGGGLLDAAIEIADEFLSDDKLIVYTKGSHSSKKEYRCRRKGLFEDGKVFVLLNQFSASASEVLAGALQDWDRAMVIGVNSFGKGLVQEQFELKNGSMLRLTVAKYYTPSGRCIQKKYSLNGEGQQAYLPLSYADSLHIHLDTFRTSKGKIVFGENGIQPDVPMPTELIKDTIIQELQKTFLINNYAYTLFHQDFQRLMELTTYNALMTQYKISSPQFDDFIKLINSSFEKQKIELIKIKQALIDPMIKKELSQLLFSSSVVFENTFKQDTYILEAIKKSLQ